MGAGRQTQTYTYDTRSDGSARFEAEQRNLQDALGGVVFRERGWGLCACVAGDRVARLPPTHPSPLPPVCTNDTLEECERDLVFGLPSASW